MSPLSCPFCGSAANLRPQPAHEVSEGLAQMVSCGNDDCIYSIFQVEVASWNRRPTPQAAPLEALRELIQAIDPAAWSADTYCTVYELTPELRGACAKAHAVLASTSSTAPSEGKEKGAEEGR